MQACSLANDAQVGPLRLSASGASTHVLCLPKLVVVSNLSMFACLQDVLPDHLRSEGLQHLR